VCGDEKHIFILSSKDMKLHLKKMLWHENGNKWMIYVIERKNKWYFRTKSDEDNIDITEHLNDFDQLTQ
jgi:phage pi2 protein 07